jgi:hypothetical protein
MYTMWNRLKLSAEVRALRQSLVLSPTRARFLLLLLPYYWATCSFSALLNFATAIYSVQVRCHNWQVASWSFFRESNVLNNLRNLSKNFVKIIVLRKSVSERVWFYRLLVSDFYIFSEYSYVICSFRQNFRNVMCWIWRNLSKNFVKVSCSKSKFRFVSVRVWFFHLLG